VILVDSSVIIDILEQSPWMEWSDAQIKSALRVGPVYMNPIIYGEVSAAFQTPEHLDVTLRRIDIERLDLPFEAAFVAAKALRAYRARGGARTTMLPDDLIGAHAEVAALTLLTRDPRLVRSYFPNVTLIAPG
jgi:predicted nucleic acid-binding protein